ncbi:MAG: MotA/TolQ/ExbB proton channel family protein [Bacteroidetes bacterium]|jgi:chemotaxis protein MotA|nr:MotA/TolQ/ExbB proton channel family protein [Bacteroidota bacterium]
MKKTIEIGTVAGLAFGIISIFGSFLMEGGKIGALIMIPAMVIVFGGTFATAMIGTSFNQFGKIWKFAIIAFMPPKHDVEKLIESIVHYATVARKDGLLSLEKELNELQHAFLKKMLRFAIDGTDPQTMRAVADAEMGFLNERHLSNAQIFQKMGGYAPTMGIIGTVMGLIVTLANAGGDPNDLIHHIASAFIATLWGIFTANIIWLPLADKLKTIHGEENLVMEVTLEGVLAVQAGEIPAIVKAKLMAMLPSSQQGEI